MKKTPSHSYKFSPSREAQLGAKVILLSTAVKMLTEK